MQGLCDQLTRGVHLPYISIYKQHSNIQGNCHSSPLDVNTNVKLAFLTTTCQC